MVVWELCPDYDVAKLESSPFLVLSRGKRLTSLEEVDKIQPTQYGMDFDSVCE